MTEIPHAVLSEHFQARMKGRRLVSGIFLTFRFDPGFFEQEVLPVVLDVPLSHAVAIRLVQLEDCLRSLRGELAVYYDANGLVPSTGSAKLDVRRIPVRHPTGIFHPKNSFLLVEDENADEFGHHARSLIVASLSANLTRAGWWENVEACHVEEVVEGEKSRLKQDLAGFLQRLRNSAPGAVEQAATDEILQFLRRETDQRQQRSSKGQLHTHFFAGRESLPDFLERVAGPHLQRTYLEVISPYFDDAADCQPLQMLIDRFAPKEVRVFLPRSSAGEALCRPELYEAVRARPNVQWGRLPDSLLRLGKSSDAGQRFVHAKIYRFFTQNPKREICFIGSTNLTGAAHQRGGNLETGFLCDIQLPRRPEFWLLPDQQRPTEFDVRTEDESAAATGGSHLNLRYHWHRNIAEAFWDDSAESPTLRLTARGMELGSVGPLAPRVWVVLEAAFTGELQNILAETSFVEVDDSNEGRSLVLVQEEGMSHKPSLLLHLSTADILRYWSLLTVEQRAAFLEARAPDIGLLGEGADLVVRARTSLEHDTLFDRFAGFFHAFGCLERAVRSALESGKTREAEYRLFGQKYDSLGSLLDRVLAEQGKDDDIDRYILTLCARQLCRDISHDHPEFWRQHQADARKLDGLFVEADSIRERLVASDANNLDGFLDWFERWFIRRAKPVEVDA